MTTLRFLIFGLLATVTASHGELLVYEPFDYKHTCRSTFSPCQAEHSR